jgi:8-amino-7-oxononanoate synthase
MDADRLKSLKAKGLYRFLEVVETSNQSSIRIHQNHFLNFSSNNYLGLATHPQVLKNAAKALKIWGAGSGASRLLSGTLKIHALLEEKLAVFKKEESALVFSSGYLANLGAMSAFLDSQSLVLVDRLNHASLIDGARLSGAKLWVYPHADVDALKKLLIRGRGFKNKWVVTDGYFSMDGDVAPLDKIFEICRDYQARLMVDEAHSTGIFGKTGAGLSEHFGLHGQIDAVMGTLSKSLGSVGGFIAGGAILKETLINFSRSFIYTTAPAPAASAAACAALDLILKEPTLREKLWRNCLFVREGLLGLGFDLARSQGPIIPVWIGDTAKVLRVREMLRKENIFAPAIRPPTVPKGTDRIRLSVMATHSKSDLEKLLAVFKKIRDKIL